MISKFRIQTPDIMIKIALHLLSSLHHTIVAHYYTVAEMHIILSEVDLSRLVSRSRVLKSVPLSQSNDTD